MGPISAPGGTTRGPRGHRVTAGGGPRRTGRRTQGRGAPPGHGGRRGHPGGLPRCTGRRHPPRVPEDALPPVRAQVALFELVRDNADDLERTYLSPPAVITPRERTGAYRTGDHQLLSDGEGNGHISTEDYAVALVD